MGDIICRNCGEPWHAYGARHGDMKSSQYRMLITGKGCPACDGKPVYDCSKFAGIYVPYDMRGTNASCTWLTWGMVCNNPLSCEEGFKNLRPKPGDVRFLSSLADSTDEDEALNAADLIRGE